MKKVTTIFLALGAGFGLALLASAAKAKAKPKAEPSDLDVDEPETASQPSAAVSPGAASPSPESPAQGYSEGNMSMPGAPGPTSSEAPMVKLEAGKSYRLIGKLNGQDLMLEEITQMFDRSGLYTETDAHVLSIVREPGTTEEQALWHIATTITPKTPLSLLLPATTQTGISLPFTIEKVLPL